MTRTRTIVNYVVAIAAGMVVFCLIALPTCIVISSMQPHPWWGVLVTMPVTAIGVFLGGAPTARKVLRWMGEP